MAMNKELDSTLADLAEVRGATKRLDEEEAKGPSAPENLQFIKQEVVAGRDRYTRYLTSRAPTDTFYSNGAEDQKAVFDRDCFFRGDEMIKTFTEWQRSQPAGLSPAERHKQVTALKSSIEAGWSKYLAQMEKLQEAGQIFDWPADAPVGLFLQYMRRIGRSGKCLGWWRSTTRGSASAPAISSTRRLVSN